MRSSPLAARRARWIELVASVDPPERTDSSPSSTPKPNETRARVAYLAAVGAIVAIGFAIRARLVLPVDFPLNDGALFLVMIDAVRDSAPSLPWYVSYNGLEIPFAYPPLPFMVAAALSALGLSPIDALRYLPLAANTLVIAAFAVLARAVLPTRVGAALATLLVAVLPGAYVWQIMGGGLTRAFGLLFAVLALTQAYLLVVRGQRIHLVLLGIFASLSVLSHGEMAWFTMLGVAAILAGFGRRWEAFRDVALAAVLAALITAPWWLTVLLRHGPSPILAAGQTGMLWASARDDAGGSPVGPRNLAITAAGAALFLAAIAVGGRRSFTAGAIGLLIFLEHRSFAQLSVPLLALTIAGLLAGGLALYRQRGSGAAAASPLPNVDYGRRVALVLDVALLGATCCLAFLLSAYVDGRLLGRFGPPTAALAPSERASMQWVAEHTEPTARFVVISGDYWAEDRSAEWFPVLAGRKSVATVQGTEWLPGKEYNRQMRQHTTLEECGQSDVDCLERWARETGTSFDYLYLADRSTVICCAGLRTALEADPRYTAVYRGPGASVYRRSDSA